VHCFGSKAVIQGLNGAEFRFEPESGIGINLRVDVVLHLSLNVTSGLMTCSGLLSAPGSLQFFGLMARRGVMRLGARYSNVVKLSSALNNQVVSMITQVSNNA
jgi:hypothetical protein